MKMKPFAPVVHHIRTPSLTNKFARKKVNSYVFERTAGINSSFTNYIWVRNGYVFNRFDNIAIEFSSGNSVAFEYYDSSGKLIDRHEHDSLSNWQSCGVTTQLWPNVKIKLVNTGGGTVTIRSGSVVYNYQ